MGKVALALCRSTRTKSKCIAAAAAAAYPGWPRQDVQILRLPDPDDMLPKPVILPILKPITEEEPGKKRESTPIKFVSPPHLVLWREGGVLRCKGKPHPCPEHVIDQALYLTNIGCKSSNISAAAGHRKQVQPTLQRLARERSPPLGLLPVKSPVPSFDSSHEIRGRSTFSPGHPLLREIKCFHDRMSYPYGDYVPDWSTPKQKLIRRKSPPPYKGCASGPVSMMATAKARAAIHKQREKFSFKHPHTPPSWGNTNHELSAWGDEWHEGQPGNTFESNMGAIAQHLSGVEIWNCLNGTPQ